MVETIYTPTAKDDPFAFLPEFWSLLQQDGIKEQERVREVDDRCLPVLKEVIARRLQVAPDPAPEPLTRRRRRDIELTLLNAAFKDEFTGLLADGLLWCSALPLHDRPPGRGTCLRRSCMALLQGELVGLDWHLTCQWFDLVDNGLGQLLGILGGVEELFERATPQDLQDFPKCCER